MTSYQRNAYVFSTIVAFGGFVFGLDAALISGTVNFISQEFSLTDLQLGAVVSAPGLGVLLALPFAGLAANRLGRKLTLQIIAALYLVSAVCSVLAPTFATLVAARFLGGLAFSSITLASMYIGEIAAPRWRGKMVSMIQINIVIGLSAAYFINYLILKITGSSASWVETLGINSHTWRWMLASEILPALLWFLLLALIPKSPSWLIYKGRIEEAKLALLKIIPASEIPQQVASIQESLRDSDDNHAVISQLKEIFGKPMRLTLIIGVTIAIAQQATGINAILFYAPTVIEQLGLGTDAAFMQAIWFGITSVIFTVLAILLVDRVGRRPMIIGGLVWIVISLAICSYGFNSARYALSDESMAQLNEIPHVERLSAMIGVEYKNDIAFKNALKQYLGDADARDYASVLLQKAASLNAFLILIGIISFIAAFHFSVGPLMWVLFSELFPISIRGIAIPLFALLTSFTSYLVQQFFPWQLATMGGAAIFLFYAAMVSIGLVILYRVLPETKNLSIEEIQLALQSKAKS